MGCAQIVKYDAGHYAQAGSEAPGMATIVVAHGTEGYGSAWWQNVLVDDKKVGDLRQNTYVRANIAPGHHQISAGSPMAQLTTQMRTLGVEGDFEANKTYYMIWEASEASQGAGIRVTYHFRPMLPSEGRSTMLIYKDRTQGAKSVSMSTHS